MTGTVVLLGLIAGVAWILRCDSAQRGRIPSSAWIVVGWMVIHGTRPVTSWMGGPMLASMSAESYDEGNATEAVINLILIVAAFIVVKRRGIRFASVATENKWLVAVYVFWLLSIGWSDYPVITFKRLVKDLGNVLMVLVVLTAGRPGEVLKAVMVRFGYLTIPLSVVLMRFYPSWGRTYVGYSRSEVMWIGVATHKNSLGILALITALFVLWEVLDVRGRGSYPEMRVSRGAQLLLLGLSWYVLLTVDSVTSLLCAVIGSMLLLLMRWSWIASDFGRLEALVVAAAMLVWLLSPVMELGDAFLDSVGRDRSLTTRTEVWPILVRYVDNPLVGVGFNSFWAGERLVSLRESVGGIVQAHNGYLETYLNGGWVGCGLLLALVGSAYVRLRGQLVLGVAGASIRVATLAVAVIHNYSEASFWKVGVLWLATLFAIVEYEGEAVSPEEAWSGGGREDGAEAESAISMREVVS